MGDVDRIREPFKIVQQLLFPIDLFPASLHDIMPAIRDMDKDQTIKLGISQQFRRVFRFIMGCLAQTDIKMLLRCNFRKIGKIVPQITGMEDGFVLFLKMQHIRKTAGIAFRSSAGAKMFGADGTDGER